MSQGRCGHRRGGGERGRRGGLAAWSPEERGGSGGGHRLVLSCQFLRERLPGATHAESAANAKRLHGTASQGAGLLKNLGEERVAKEGLSCQIGELGWAKLPGENLQLARSLPFQNGTQNCEDEPDDGQQ